MEIHGKKQPAERLQEDTQSFVKAIGVYARIAKEIRDGEEYVTVTLDKKKSSSEPERDIARLTQALEDHGIEYAHIGSYILRQDETLDVSKLLNGSSVIKESARREPGLPIHEFHGYTE